MMITSSPLRPRQLHDDHFITMTIFAYISSMSKVNHNTTIVRLIHLPPQSPLLPTSAPSAMSGVAGLAGEDRLIQPSLRPRKAKLCVWHTIWRVKMPSWIFWSLCDLHTSKNLISQAQIITSKYIQVTVVCYVWPRAIYHLCRYVT